MIKNLIYKYVSAKEVNAYPGTEMLRTMALIKDEDFEKPYLLDIMKVTSDRSKPI